MAVSDAARAAITARYQALLPHLNERQRRLWAGAEAASAGPGGVEAVAQATGLSVNTVRSGKRELEAPPADLTPAATEQIRRPGAGRKFAEDLDPGLVGALEAIVDPVTRGDPMSPLRWSAKSTRAIAQELTEQGHPVSHHTVERLLKAQNYSLQATRKRFEGTDHPDRDAQFQYLAKTAQSFLDRGLPVLSLDAKKKELVGNFQNKGREWHPKGQPEEVEAYDFLSLAVGKAAPYGVYDVTHDEGWVSVGVSADTAEFAVNTLRAWYAQMGRARFPEAREVLLTADCGGSNSNRARLWKRELQRFATETGLTVTVVHYPPGTSKWNRIEHRLFNHITMNWRGRPLLSYQVVVECIANTTTSTGLSVQAALDERVYHTGIKVSDHEMAQIQLRPHDFHGEWNYSISPAT